jgi:hypothetical protein
MTRGGLRVVRFVPDFAEQHYGALPHPNPHASTPSDWLLRLHPLHPASDLTDLAAALPDSLIDLWREHVADPSPLPRRGPEDWGPREAYGDDEDFLEQIWRLHAVASALGADRVFVQVGDDIRALGDRAVPADTTDMFRWGAQTTTEERAHPIPAEVAADRYYTSNTFRRVAGRDIAVCDLRTNEGPHLLTEVRRLAHPDTGEVFVKVVDPVKGGHASVTIDPNADDDDLREQLTWFNDGLAGLFHHGRVALVQQAITMRYEYRFFVVDGILVTGAGCIEELTPSDRPSGVLHDPRIREHRGVGDVVRDYDIVYALYRGAEAFARAWTLAGDAPSEYVVDVALDSAGKVVVVEVNGIRNSGLYASSPQAVVQALLDHGR